MVEQPSFCTLRDMNTRFIGKVYLRFDELPSTNDYALALLDAPAVGSVFPSDKTGQWHHNPYSNTKPSEGTVVRAASQSAGRGQFGSQWQSKPGQNLLLSIILYPVWLEAASQFYLSMAVSLAVREAAEGSMANGQQGMSDTQPPRFEIKWPNDLYIGSRKSAGILIQNALAGNRLQSSVVGIGLNVNQLDFDPSLPNPTSLAAVFGQNFDLDNVAERLLECLEHRYEQLRSGHRAALRSEYEHSLLGFGKMARYARPDGTELEGTVRGVTKEGRLRIERVGGEEETFGMKEVSPVFHTEGTAVPWV